MRLFLTIACAMAIFASAGAMSSSGAQETSWKVTSVQGVVRVSQRGQASSTAYLNEILANGATLTTGADSRATVENGSQNIVVASHSRMTIAPDSSSAMTRIIEDFGYLLFKVDHRAEPHFRVETPLLAAIVKGTTFSVSTDPREDMVHVVQGLVEIQLKAGRDHSSDVATGGTGWVLRTAPEILSLSGSSNPPRAETQLTPAQAGRSDQTARTETSAASPLIPGSFSFDETHQSERNSPIAIRLTDVFIIVVIVVIAMFAGRALFSRFLARKGGGGAGSFNSDADATSRRRRR
jgi:hypothetical protein